MGRAGFGSIQGKVSYRKLGITIQLPYRKSTGPVLPGNVICNRSGSFFLIDTRFPTPAAATPPHGIESTQIGSFCMSNTYFTTGKIYQVVITDAALSMRSNQAKLQSRFLFFAFQFAFCGSALALRVRNSPTNGGAIREPVSWAPWYLCLSRDAWILDLIMRV